MEPLRSELTEVCQGILRTETNFKKLGKSNIRSAIVKSRIEILDQRWQKCENLHLQIKATATTAERESPDYFTKNKILQVEDAYLSAHDFLINQLDLVTPVSNTSDNTNQSLIARHDSLPIKLPQIILPVFSGDYKDWENFRDMFDALIIQNDSLSNVTRLHYLKSSLKGEAEQLLKHVIITEVNFVSTWESLRARYDNKRALITSHLQEFISFPNVSNNVLADLKKLRDTTNESLAALKNLHPPIDSWSDLLVFLTINKLDIQSLKEWEMQIGFESDYTTYKELDSFLEKRIRVLEAIQASKTNAKTSSQDKNKNAKQSGLRSHNASSISKCLLCKDNHPLFKCGQFKALSVEGRKEVVTRHQGCYNCFTPGHRPFNYTRKLKCSKCGRKHNTLLHVNNLESITTPSTDTMALHSQLAISGSSAPPDNNTGTIAQVARANHVSLNNESNDDLSYHFLNNHPNISSSTLLATAIITLQADNGKANKFRVLLDQGSECCFISERVMKILNPSFQKVKAVVYGVGGINIGSSRKSARLNLLPTENHSPKVLIKALVLLHLTSYTSPERPNWKSDTHLSELKLADPNPFGSQQIDLILGADKYGSCLLPGLQQGVLGTLTAQSTVFGWILSGQLWGIRLRKASL